MSDCVKLSVVDAISGAANTVSSIAEVHMNETIQNKREMYEHPVAFINCFGEETTSHNNRLETCQFDMTVEIWAEGSSVHRTLENLRAELRKALYSSSALSNLNAAVREKKSRHYSFTEADLAGSLVVEYEVIYATGSMDPFTQNGY